MARDGTTTAQRDHPGRWPRPLTRRSPAHLALLAGLSAGLAVYAWVVAGTTPFTRGALIGVLFPAAVLGTIALVRPPERIPPPDELDMTGMSYWVICLAAFFEWEASAWRWHPPSTNRIDPLMEPPLHKSAAILVGRLAGGALGGG